MHPGLQWIYLRVPACTQRVGSLGSGGDHARRARTLMFCVPTILSTPLLRQERFQCSNGLLLHLDYII